MPPLDPQTQALLAYYMQLMGGMGMGDSSMAGMFGGLIQPNVNKYGELDMFGSDLQKSNLNQYQDIYGSLDDPMNTLLSGLGGVGAAPLGGGVVGGGGLNPITTETIVETPVLQQMGMLANMGMQGGPVTPESYVANMLVNQGAMPSVIVSDLMAKMQDPTLDAATKNLFKSWLPQTQLQDMQGNPTGETTIDWNAASKKIEDLAMPYLQETAKISGPNMGQNAYGQYVQYSEQPSEMMQYLQKMGLPDPRAQYGIDFSIQSDPELANLYQTIGVKGQEFDAAKQAYEGFLKKYPTAKALSDRATAMAQGRETKADEQYKTDLQQYARDMAKWATGESVAPAQPKQASEGGPGVPGWMKSVGNAVTGLPGEVNDAIGRLHGRPDASGAYRTPEVNLLPEVRSTPPTMPTRQVRPPSLIEQMYSRINADPRRQYALAGNMHRASRSMGDDMLAMARAIAPGYGAMQAGRTPFKDAIMQRLQPLLAVGAAG